ncbi:uridine kinase [Desulfosporosinus sp. BICA1-9]|uniref:uridine kinase family protein n=1 Tax=Desulfosporosinus sp. BICA1-9 TaxID=1531958 RepID=UPI00054C4AC0|nr:nucleoside kinase [Desulfosporosinus sp. BICA1-9]KJS50403.1 MAG: uridine kinase [Peptococcaceae bacterium BRH_c23]KJS82234.1 MAG: uridine kinase [Desulfosporosinus sp. BICA1-9]HBW37966.1 nucleoside kinase [Desulfosporosinus sp.]
MSDYTIRRYRQSLILGLIGVVKELFPEEQLKITHSILDGVYCELEDSLLSSREVQKIEDLLKEWVIADQPISYASGSNHLFNCSLNNQDVCDALYPPFESSGSLKYFQLIHYPPGFILHFPNANHPELISPFVPPEQLSATYSETQRWLENLHLSKVQDVNTIISENSSPDLIYLAEALHEKKISSIADKIFDQRRNVRVILISGPTSSGKTTFAQRLSTQLRVNGLRPVALSLDNYFLPREQTPLDAFGQYDFECLEALDLPLLATHLNTLIGGSEVETPVFDFVCGGRCPTGKPMRLSSNEILVIEGIHALNPRLLPSLDRNQMFKIYISALFQLNLDVYNRVSTTDVRLIRRLVRDNQFRGINPERTLAQWDSVRRGENHNIFPYQEEADVMFNSSLLYELNALRPSAEELLKSVPRESPTYKTAIHLLTLLSFFNPLDTSTVPFNSILREFMGGSAYQV